MWGGKSLKAMIRHSAHHHGSNRYVLFTHDDNFVVANTMILTNHYIFDYMNANRDDVRINICSTPP